MIIRSQRPKEEVLEIVRSIKKYIHGPDDPYGIGEAFWSEIVDYLYEKIHTAFLIKAAGGVDELGNSWKPLSPTTKAYKRPELRSGLSLPGPKKRPTLTEHQDAVWRRIFVHSLKRLTKKAVLSRPLLTILGKKASVVDAELRAMGKASRDSAAAIAWNAVKEQLGAETLMMLLEDADALILISGDGGDLLASLEPTHTNPYQPAPNQIYKHQNGVLSIGSTLPYANKHHSPRNPNNQRRLWPEDISPWLREAMPFGVQAVRNRLIEIL